MLQQIETRAGTVRPGDTLRIRRMEDHAPSFTFSGGKDKAAAGYNGKTGVVQFIDDMKQIHGTWGGLAVNPETDDFEIVRA